MVSQQCFFRLGGYRYYIGKSFTRHGVAGRFDPDGMALICLSEGSEETIRIAAQGLTKAELMGELAVLKVLPNYQLALPFSLEAWRQLEYANHLIGKTLGKWIGMSLRDTTNLLSTSLQASSRLWQSWSQYFSPFRLKYFLDSRIICTE